jgi:hypothetical protein
VLHVFNHAITSSVFPSMWKVAIIRPVAKVGTPSGPSDFRPINIVSVLYLKRLNAFSMIRCCSMAIVAICCWIFSLVSDVGIVPRLLWSELPRI